MSSSHDIRCPLSRPHLYDPDEGPLECLCDELAANDLLLDEEQATDDGEPE